MVPSRRNWETTVCRIASLTLVNALIFQDELAAHNPQVKPLRSLLRSRSLGADLVDHWTFIIEKINYVPIFKVAASILAALPSSTDSELKSLVLSAQQIVSMRAALRHDLMGRIYHRLLLDAKYLGTYYTSVPAATLLLKIALNPVSWGIDWANIEEIESLAVADLACGTGTLLMACVQAVSDNYVRASTAIGKKPDLTLLHGRLMESVLNGYDVVPSALHLTASTLALLAPGIAFKRMKLYCLPLGDPGQRLGSIDFLESHSVGIQQDMFGAVPEATQVTGRGPAVVSAPLGPLDLAVMNPPFTRSVGDNLLFGNLPEAERGALQARLRTLLGQPGVLAQSTAGLAAVFIAVADRFVKPGGRQALVVPRTILSGVAWEETRRLLSSKYDVEYVVVSHDPRKWSFSENTELSEALIVAQKRTDATKTRQTVLVNLWRNPASAITALSAGDAIIDAVPATLRGQGVCRVKVGESEWGEVLLVPFGKLGDKIWWHHAYAQTDLIRFADGLLAGTFRLPGEAKRYPLKLCPLRELGEIGPDRRDVYDGFEISATETPYLAFWGHNQDEVTRVKEPPNAYLAGLSKATPGRPLRDPVLLWSRAGRLVLAERLWLATQRLLAVYVGEKVLSNVWWPFRFDNDVIRTAGLSDDEASKIMSMWLNSTIGLTIVWSQREDTRGAWIALKKPVWEGLPVLDPRTIGKATRAKLCSAFDSISGREMGRWREIANDDTRSALDNALSEALNLPGLQTVREMVAREPIVSQVPLGDD